MTIQMPSLRRQRDEAAPAEIVPQEAPVPAPPQAAAVLAGPSEEETGWMARFSLDVAHAIRAGRRNLHELASREGNWLAAFLAAKPRSVDEQRAYLANRRWLPAAHEGGIADRAGEAFQVAIGVPGVAFGNAVSLTCKHALRFTGVTFVILVALFAACRFVLRLPPGTCVAIPGLIAGLLAGWVAGVAGVLALRRIFGRWRAQR